MTAQDNPGGGRSRRGSLTITDLESGLTGGDPDLARRRSTVKIVAIAVAVVVATAGTLVLARLVIGASPRATTPPTTLDARAAGSGGGQVAAGGVPGSTRLALLGPLSILDNRTTDALAPGATVTLPLPTLPPRSSAVLLEVSMVDATGPGAVTLTSSAGQVTALRLPRAKMQTSTVTVVTIGTDAGLGLRTEGGGHLLVNLIGAFEPATSATSGRVVSVPPTRALILSPKTEGKNAVIDLSTVNVLREAGTFSAVVLHITADVGENGGFVALGASADTQTQVMYWTSTAGDDRTRDALLVVPIAGGSVHLHYEAGSQLAADVVGYVTDGAAPSTAVGLLVPVPPATTEPVAVPSGRPTQLLLGGPATVPAARVAGALLTVTAVGDVPGAVAVYTPGQEQPQAATLHVAKSPGRPTATLVTAVSGAVTVAGEAPASVALTPLALILGG